MERPVGLFVYIYAKRLVNAWDEPLFVLTKQSSYQNLYLSLIILHS